MTLKGKQIYSEKREHNFAVTCDFGQIKVEDYDVLVIPGSHFPEYLCFNEKVLSLVRHFAQNNKPLASICHDQQILATAGVLEGKSCYSLSILNLIYSMLKPSDRR